jgi:hypothetical protein
MLSMNTFECIATRWLTARGSLCLLSGGRGGGMHAQQLMR